MQKPKRLGSKKDTRILKEFGLKPKRLRSKRDTRILIAFGLTDVYTDKNRNKDERKNLRFMITNFAPKREVASKNGKTYIKRPKVQRLIIPDRFRKKNF